MIDRAWWTVLVGFLMMLSLLFVVSLLIMAANFFGKIPENINPKPICVIIPENATLISYADPYYESPKVVFELDGQYYLTNAVIEECKTNND